MMKVPNVSCGSSGEASIALCLLYVAGADTLAFICAMAQVRTFCAHSEVRADRGLVDMFRRTAERVSSPIRATGSSSVFQQASNRSA